MKLRDQLRGVVGFPITPFKKNLSVDYAGLEKNVAAMTQHKFCSMVAAGGTGELYSLTAKEAIEVVRVTKKNTKLPVIGGVGFNVAIGVEMAKGMEKAGADALLVLPPYYASSPVNGLFDYYAAIGQATKLPLAIYSRDWAVFSPQMVAQLCDRVPTLEIWKDGQGNGRAYERIIAYNGDRLAWVGGLGDDCFPTYVSVGVQAFTSSISNVAPKLAVELAKVGGLMPGAKGGPDFSKITPLMRKYVHPLYALREKVRGYEVSVMKTFMDRVGLAGGPVRPPLEATRPEHLAEVDKLVALYGSWCK